MKPRKILSLIMSLVMMCSVIAAMPINAAAAYSAIEVNVSPNPCYANRSTAPLPASGTPTQGDTYYINLAATTDYRLSKADFYVKAPGESAFTHIYRYKPSGYFRWVNCSYTFTSAGNYEFYISITTTSGSVTTANISTSVAAKQVETPVVTTYSGIEANVSSQPCKANLSVSALPTNQNPTQGDTYYINLAATTDYRLSKADFYVKAPGESAFTRIYRYKPGGYFRWVNYPYTFTSAGDYEFYISITTTSGSTRTANISTSVAAKQVETPVVTTYSGIEANVSSQPCKANLSVSALPTNQNPTQGDRYYINLATTTDYRLSKADFYVKAPGESAFTRIYRYKPGGYFRWVNYPYTFTSAGDYEFYISATTTSGSRKTVNISTSVAAKQVETSPSIETPTNNARITLAELQEKYPDGSKWYGRFDGSKQCCGFARLMCYEAYGSEYFINNEDNKWTKHTDSSYIDNCLKSGDYVRYRYNGHSVWVVDVIGDTVYIADCNNDWNYTVRWRTITKSELKRGFTHVYSAPYAFNSSANSVNNFTTCVYASVAPIEFASCVFSCGSISIKAS